MLEDTASATAARPKEGAALVATWTRWAVASAVLAGAFALAAGAFAAYGRSGLAFGSLGGLVGGASIGGALLVLVALRSEEARLVRELRAARTGTAVQRGIVLRRRAELPFFGRVVATRLGTAALLVAEGDSAGAEDALRRGSFLARGGPLDALRAAVLADVERASGTDSGLERSVKSLRNGPPIGHREADLYRTHVLVKALLQQGDDEGAEAVARELGGSGDEDREIYAIWLRVWFELDAEGEWPPIPEGRLRMATLLARAHGAEKLIEKLDERLSSIARSEPGG
jgi:hypothetical protein